MTAKDLNQIQLMNQIVFKNRETLDFYSFQEVTQQVTGELFYAVYDQIYNKLPLARGYLQLYAQYFLFIEGDK